MKLYKKIISLKHWIALLRRQPRHLQHLVVLILSGAITGTLGAIILYHDYGFWHETYSRNEQALEVVKEGTSKTQENIITASPGDMMGGFFKEASNRLRGINIDTSVMLQGKETYTEEKGVSGGQINTETQLQREFKGEE